MEGASPRPRLCALARCATCRRHARGKCQAGLVRATRGGPVPAARVVVILVRSLGYGLRYTPSRSARAQAVKCHENTADRLLGCLRSLAQVAPISVAWPLRGARSSRSSLRLVLRRVAPATTTSADFSLPADTLASPFQAQSEISPGKNADLPCTTAGFTLPGLWSRELRDHWLARPVRPRLVSGSVYVSPQVRSPLPSCRPRGPTLCGSLRSL